MATKTLNLLGRISLFMESGVEILNVVTPTTVSQQLSELNLTSKDILRVNINSTGGDASAGFNIANMLQDLPCPAHAYINGLAASVGAYIALKCDKIFMYGNSFMMVHYSHTCACGGKDDLLNSAEYLAELDKSMVNALLSRSNLEQPEIEEMLSKDTYLSAGDCEKYEIIDGIVNKEIDSKNAISELSIQEAIQMYNRETLASLELQFNKLTTIIDPTTKLGGKLGIMEDNSKNYQAEIVKLEAKLKEQESKHLKELGGLEAKRNEHVAVVNARLETVSKLMQDNTDMFTVPKLQSKLQKYVAGKIEAEDLKDYIEIYQSAVKAASTDNALKDVLADSQEANVEMSVQEVKEQPVAKLDITNPEIAKTIDWADVARVGLPADEYMERLQAGTLPKKRSQTKSRKKITH